MTNNDEKPVYLEIIQGNYGIGVAIDNVIVAGACGGGLMHTVKRLRINERLLKKAVNRIFGEEE